jgi:coenzyme F420-0:L-glutamate ligase/coenzyme F420-1:gamma-L-glutamate ligase
MIAAAVELEHGDVVCVAHKVVSKAEGRVVALAEVEPSERRSPSQVTAILGSSR